MNMTNDTLKPKRARNIWKIVFAISITLNIAVLGAIGGAALRFGKGPHAGKAHLKERQIGSVYMRALSRDQRRELGRQMRDLDVDNKETRANIEAGFQEAIRILRSEEFDKEAFETVVKGHAARSYQRLENAQGILLSHITSMSFDQRSAYADRIEKALNRGPKFKR
jgi:uncharacterized membrane protein